MVDACKMCESARKLRDTYAIRPGITLFKKEFGYYCLEEWYNQGLSRDADLAKIFDYDPPGHVAVCGLGGCQPAFFPAFEERLIQDGEIRK